MWYTDSTYKILMKLEKRESTREINTLDLELVSLPEANGDTNVRVIQKT